MAKKNKTVWKSGKKCGVSGKESKTARRITV